MLQAGIIGLPNVGKSTLFNALIGTRKAETANYPFCTIDSNIGVVKVPDNRLEALSAIAPNRPLIPAAIEFADIAGLVEGANKGEGLGNKFLAGIRETDAIVEVVRCFEDENIVHNMGTVDPLRDIETISAELILADLQSVETQLQKNIKRARGGDRESRENVALLERLHPHLNAMKPALTLPLEGDNEGAVLSRLFLLSAKPILFSCNVDDSDIADPAANPHVAEVERYVRNHHHAGVSVICAKLEEELDELSSDEAAEFLKEMGVEDAGVSLLIKATCDLLGLASFFTIGEKEIRAWTFKIGMTAPQCAGAVHSDFESGFIKAEVVSFADLASHGSIPAAREAGIYRMEGKDYRFQDGDVAFFRFHN